MNRDMLSRRLTRKGFVVIAVDGALAFLKADTELADFGVAGICAWMRLESPVELRPTVHA